MQELHWLSNVLDKFDSNSTSLLSNDRPMTVRFSGQLSDLPEGYIMCIEPPLLIVEMQSRTLDCACLYRKLVSGGYS